jgi:exopolysaccharide production repressor protein
MPGAQATEARRRRPQLTLRKASLAGMAYQASCRVRPTQPEKPPCARERVPLSLPVFLRGLILLLAAFAIASYAITGSAWTVFVDSMLCALVLQVGYFGAVLFMIWNRGGDVRSRDRHASRRPAGNEGNVA